MPKLNGTIKNHRRDIKLVISFMKYLIALIYLHATLNKLINLKKHINYIYQYKLIKNKHFIFVLSLVFIMLEIVISVCLMSNMYIKEISLIAIFLLIVYTIAIINNLIKNNKEINCGLWLWWGFRIRNIGLVLTV